MTLQELAVKALSAAEDLGANFMAVGAIAAGAYGVPRSTRDVDLLVEVTGGKITQLIERLSDEIAFDEQVQFDTLTWGRRHVGITKQGPPLKVELFEVFDDPFVASEFSRRRKVFVPMLGMNTWLPTAEDVVVQKLRWAREKDLLDVADILVVQTEQNLDMNYIKKWCGEHGSMEKLETILAKL